jgi:hypothetical protein
VKVDVQRVIPVGTANVNVSLDENSSQKLLHEPPPKHPAPKVIIGESKHENFVSKKSIGRTRESEEWAEKKPQVRSIYRWKKKVPEPLGPRKLRVSVLIGRRKRRDRMRIREEVFFKRKFPFFWFKTKNSIEGKCSADDPPRGRRKRVRNKKVRKKVSAVRHRFALSRPSDLIAAAVTGCCALKYSWASCCRENAAGSVCSVGHKLTALERVAWIAERRTAAAEDHAVRMAWPQRAADWLDSDPDGYRFLSDHFATYLLPIECQQHINHKIKRPSGRMPSFFVWHLFIRRRFKRIRQPTLH